jgi:hypothetical protein
MQVEYFATCKKFQRLVQMSFTQIWIYPQKVTQTISIKFQFRCHLLNIILTTSDPLSLEHGKKKGEKWARKLKPKCWIITCRISISTSISLQARAPHQGPLQAISPAPYPPSGRLPQSSYSGQNSSRAPPLAHLLTELLLTLNFTTKLPCDLLSLPWLYSALRVFLPVSPDHALMDVLPSNTWRASVYHPLSK